MSKNSRVMIGLTGRKGVGKSTVAQYLRDHHGFVEYAFAFPLKEACQILFLLSDEQMEDRVQKETKDSRWDLSPRQIFQMIGTDLFRNHFRQDFWIRRFELWLETIPSDTPIVVSDIRFQDEADAVRIHKGWILGIECCPRSTNDCHASELQTISGIDYHIQNNKTMAHLYDTIDDIMVSIYGHGVR
jgi:hypothetical protein